MKKDLIIIFILIIFVSTICYAGVIIQKLGGECSPCSDYSTEELAWNGDYDADCGGSPDPNEQKTACVSDGASTEEGSLNGAASISNATGGEGQPSSANGYYFKGDGDGDYLQFNAINGTDEIGYIDANCYIVNDDTDSVCVIFTIKEHTDQKVVLSVSHTRLPYITHTSTGNGDPNNQSNITKYSAHTVSEDSWFNVKCAYDINNGVGGSHYLGIKVNDNDWEYSDSQIYAWADGEEPDGTYIGEIISGPGNDIYFIDEVHYWKSNDGT